MELVVVGGGVDDVMMRTIEQNISTLYSELLPLFAISNSSFRLPPGCGGPGWR
jgi:hypothetical protein